MHKSFDPQQGARRDTGENDRTNALGFQAETNSAPAEKSLEGTRILLAEDEALVAMTLTDLVEDAGARPIGPFATVRDCKAALESELPDAAILDVRLCDGESYPIAEMLVDRGVKVIFHSGHMIEKEWLGNPDMVRFCSKPCRPEKMREVLLSAIAK